MKKQLFAAILLTLSLGTLSALAESDNTDLRDHYIRIDASQPNETITDRNFLLIQTPEQPRLGETRDNRSENNTRVRCGHVARFAGCF